MPHRFQLLEKIAFSLVVASAMACTSFLTYEQCPDVRTAIHDGRALMRESAKYTVVCAPSDIDPCSPITTY